jgi:hypothetical protein
MEQPVIESAMVEMRRFIKEALAGRPFDDVPPLELAAIHDAADAHILQIYGARGWDIAAAASTSRLTQAPSPDFGAWKELYSDLEALAGAQSLASFHVHDDYAGDNVASVSCADKDEIPVIANIQALLSSNAAYRALEVTVNILDSSNVLVRSATVKPST